MKFLMFATPSILLLGLFGVQEKNIPAPLGQNVTVNCRYPGNDPIVAVNVTRADLGVEYVLYWRDGHMDPDNQHPSFQNRVQLGDCRINHGSLCFTVLNVKSTDYGTYKIECKIKSKEGGIKKKLMCIVSLTAPASDTSAGNTAAGNNMAGKPERLFILTTLLLFVVLVVDL